MMMKRNLLYVFSGICLLIISCSENPQKKDTQLVIENKEVEVNATEKPVTIDGLKKIFYDLTTPVELTEFVKFSNTSYNADLVNSTNNKGKYTTNLKHALNLGVYGTDLIYSRMYDQRQEAILYLSIIQQFTEELGIPKTEISNTLNRVEESMEKKDSIFSLIRKAYADADKYLNESDRNSTAALIYFGAWTEALNIATHLYNEEGANREVIGLHIAQQKFSLNSLLELLSNTYDVPDIHHYMVLVKRLKKIYDEIEIVVDSKSAKIDTVEKVIVIDEDNTKITPEQVEEISKAIRRIRADIIA